MKIFVPTQHRMALMAKYILPSALLLTLLFGMLSFTSRPVAGSEVPDNTQQEGGLTVDPKDRAAAKTFFQDIYMSTEGVTQTWDGDYATCNEGSADPVFDNALLLHVNYFRAMAGIPANITLNEEFNRKVRKAALIMSANGALTHNVTPDLTCFSEEGKEGAANSNLTNTDGWDVIGELYMKDGGAGNFFLGHRRWILHPQTQTMGVGSVPAIDSYEGANGLWVNDGNAFNPYPETRDGYIAWPPPGFVPSQVAYPRWSFGRPNANYDNTTVTMTKNGVPINVVQEQVFPFLQVDTLAWIPEGLDSMDSWPAVTEDAVYEVTLNNVVIDDVPQNLSYTVTIFDGLSVDPTPTNTPAPTATPVPTATPAPTNTPVPPTPVPTSTPLPDADGDGIPDAVECPEGADNDMDGDGLLNCEDADSDGDGIRDAVENLPSGVVALEEGPRDSDGDGDPDYLDTDSDNDSISDTDEAFDNDQDGLPDPVEVDPTGVGIQDSNQNGLDDAFEGNQSLANTDGDELPNWRDSDDDNDGVGTRTEIEHADIRTSGYLDSDVVLLPPLVTDFYLPIIAR